MKAIVGGLLAFLGGVVVGVLYAPTSGAATRRQLVKKGKKLGDKAAGAVESAGELVERTRRRIA